MKDMEDIEKGMIVFLRLLSEKVEKILETARMRTL